MKLEAIEPTRSPLGKLRLRFEGEKTMLVFPSVIADLGLYVGIDVPEAALSSIEESNAEVSAKQRAVRIISASSVSKKELAHRLKQKGESDEHIETAVAWLDDLKLLDDRKVAEQVVRSGHAKGYGAARIKQMLYEKRVPQALWEEALAELPDSDDAIDSFLQKRFRGRTHDRAECKRATDALLRRGHRWGDIRAALERYAPEEDFSGYEE